MEPDRASPGELGGVRDSKCESGLAVSKVSWKKEANHETAEGAEVKLKR
jgi:hypothetical protein